MSNGAKKPPVVVLRERLLSRRQELEHALQGSGVGVDIFIRAATTAMQTMPELAECSFESMWIALLKACRDQLLPDGVQGAIIPFNRQATWIPMYRGLLNRFERSGFYKSIKTGFHRKDDIAWRVWTDETGPHFMHEEGPGEGEILHTYASATLTTGGFFLETVTPKDMAHVRSKSRARRDDAPWKEWPEQMERKTALKRLLKILPMPAPLTEFARRDDEDDGGDDLGTEPTAPPPRPRGAQAALEQFAQEAPQEETKQSEGQTEIQSPSAATSAPQTAAAAGDGSRQSASVSSNERTAVRSPSIVPDDDSAAADPITIAYRRGKEAKAQGHRRNAIPGEFRTVAREGEIKAWLNGFDDKPMDAP